MKTVPHLYRNNAVNRINDIITKYSNVEDICELYRRFLMKTVNDTEILYGLEKTECELMWKKGEEEIFIDPHSFCWIYVRGRSVRHSFEFATAFDENHVPPQLFRMREWWGADLFNEFNIQ